MAVVPLRMIVPVTAPNGPLSTASEEPSTSGFSEEMFSESIENPNGSPVPIRSLSTCTESAPSLLRSLPVWSLIMNRPPPAWTKFRMAVFSAAVNSTFGSGSTNALNFDRSSGLAPDP